MKTTLSYKIWQIAYPIGIYYVVSSIVYFALGLVLGDENETYMLRQIVCAVATILVTMSFYRQDKQIENTVYEKKKFTLNAEQIKNIILSVAAGALLGIAINNILVMTALPEASAGFKEANEAFFGGRMVYELLGSCLLVPIAEELLFRGVVYKRLRLMLDVRWALVLSAVIFGAMHFNLVQFLYAGIIGLFLAFLVEKTRYLYPAVLGHIAANTVAVIRQETGCLDFSYELTAAGIGFTALVLFVALGIITYLIKEYKEQSGSK